MNKPDAQLDDGQKRAKSRARGALNGQPGAINGTYNALYWDEYHGDSWRHPERGVFAGEWNGNNMVRSRQDFRCYHAAEMVKRGIGLYFDNAFPHACSDPITSDAYAIPGLGTQPSAGLWAQRDYHRRIWTIIREYGLKSPSQPISMIHMTNTNIVPYLTWNDMTVDLEWFYGPEPQQAKYAHEMLLAQSAGRQTGCYPFVLADVKECKTPAEQRIAERTKFGAMTVHEIKISPLHGLNRPLYDFGYGTDACTVYNYWDEGYPVTVNNPEVKTLLLKRGAELMLVICSWGKEPLTAEFTVATNALGVVPTSAQDVEAQTAGKPIAYDAATAKLTVPLDGYGVRVIRLK